IIFGLRAFKALYPRPNLSITPDLKFSLTMSAESTSRKAASLPSGCLRSSTMLFLFRLNIGKKPAPDPNSLRVESPPGGSTLITSAPKSANNMPQVGPIAIWVNSTTRRPSYGRRDTVLDMKAAYLNEMEQMHWRSHILGKA